VPPRPPGRGNGATGKPGSASSHDDGHQKKDTNRLLVRK
jgi:hypothetical protein